MSINSVLKKYWGYKSFRTIQKKIIEDVLDKKDTLGIIATGGGKSICFQIPAIILDGVCLVITPLIALMEEQVNILNAKGIKSIYIDSSKNKIEIENSLLNCIYGNTKFLYLSPEKLKDKFIHSFLEKININLITVDEAHCISEWGNDFRPAYRDIHEVKKIKPNATILALTATATQEVIEDIQNNLLFKSKNLIKSSIIRKNIKYNVNFTNKKEKKLLDVLNKYYGQIIIYVSTRKKAKELNEYIKLNKISCTYYHAGLSNEEKKSNKLEWSLNKKRVMVATSAFGMGINKDDVEVVIHFFLPSNMDSYVQESGRAGRNNKKAYSYIIINNRDIDYQKKLIHIKNPRIDDIKNTYQKLMSHLNIGIGDFPKNTLEFDLSIFCKKYSFSYIKTYSILNFLEKDNKLKYMENLNKYSTIKSVLKPQELYNFQISNRYFDPFINYLKRNFEGFYDIDQKIDEQKIAIFLQLSLEEVINILKRLDKFGIIKYTIKNSNSKIILLDQRKDLSLFHIDINQWSQKNKHLYSKLDTMINFVKNQKFCRNKLILGYFNEREQNECGSCDICD